MLADGQLHGGVMQGAGQAFGEHCLYDADNGQLLAGSFMDYVMPRADLIARCARNQVVPAPGNALGAKGAGEAGTTGAAPACMNAVLNALRAAGVEPSRHAGNARAHLGRAAGGGAAAHLSRVSRAHLGRDAGGTHPGAAQHAARRQVYAVCASLTALRVERCRPGIATSRRTGDATAVHRHGALPLPASLRGESGWGEGRFGGTNPARPVAQAAHGCEFF